MVPALLGLKGNLEMTLASRLSTQVRLLFSPSPTVSSVSLCSALKTEQLELISSLLELQANLGNMDSAKEQWKMVGGNLALIQVRGSSDVVVV